MGFGDNQSGYDKISLLRGTESDLKSMVDNMKPYELAIAKDSNAVFYKAENGELKSITADVTIENKQKFRAIYGVDELYDIKQSLNWKVGNVAYDDATHKYYKCKVANADNFIDLQKWGEVNFNSMPTPSTGDNSNKIATTAFVNTAIKNTPQLIDFGGYASHNATSKLLAIPIVFTKGSIFTNQANSHTPDMSYFFLGSSIDVTEGTFEYHSKDSNYYYYYFTGGDDNYYTLFAK